MNTDPESAEAPARDAVEASAASSMADSANERAYGTFEVSVIEVESDNEQQQLKPSMSTDFDAPPEEAHHLCAGDCCALVSFLWLPFRLDTYKVVAFHVVNVLFAIAAAAWTVAFYIVKIALSRVASLASPLRRFEEAMLRVLLHADAVLFNSVCPRSERIVVYNASSGLHGYYAQVYFGLGKLVCSAVPGAFATVAYLWTIRNFFVVLTHSGVPASASDPTAPVENDVLILLSIVAVYAAGSLAKVFAVISRHITVFFCAEYLLYASPL